ncbi:MAG: CoA transferase, partial [Rhodospirillaceae bacterium]|nr:CoA transferase [Rhodospirillaceae bacterium]
GKALTTGGSPRYRIYRTADGRFVAAAPLEQKFWEAFCAVIDLPAPLRNDAADPEATGAAVSRIIAGRSAEEWTERFAGVDCCATIVASLQEALADRHFRARGLFDRDLSADGRAIPALPVPVVPPFRSEEIAEGYPELGEADADYLPREE